MDDGCHPDYLRHDDGVLLLGHEEECGSLPASL